MSRIEDKFIKDFDNKFDDLPDFNKIKSKIDFDEIIKPKKVFNYHFLKGFLSGFVTVLILVLGVFLFNDKKRNETTHSNFSVTTYNKVLTTIDEETAEEVLLNFVEREPVFSSDGDIYFVSNYYIVIYFNNQFASTWGEYVSDSNINEDNILEYLKLDSLKRYITLDEANGKIYIKFDAVSKVIVSKYMPEIFTLVENNGVSKVEFSIQLDPKAGDVNE